MMDRQLAAKKSARVGGLLLHWPATDKNTVKFGEVVEPAELVAVSMQLKLTPFGIQRKDTGVEMDGAVTVLLNAIMIPPSLTHDSASFVTFAPCV